MFWFGVFLHGFFWRGVFLHGAFSYFRMSSFCMASFRVTSFRMTSFRLASFRLLSLHLFGISHCVFSALCVASFRVSLLRLFVFSCGVISSFRPSAWRFLAAKRRKEMTQTSHYIKKNLQTGILQNERRVNNSIPDSCLTTAITERNIICTHKGESSTKFAHQNKTTKGTITEVQQLNGQ